MTRNFGRRVGYFDLWEATLSITLLNDGESARDNGLTSNYCTKYGYN